MARRARETSGTGVYHVMLRGINRQNIFEDEEDYSFLIKLLYQLVCPVDEKGYIVSEDGVHSKVPKIYVAGDARVKDLRQIVTATADGAIASNQVFKFLAK